MNKRPPVRSCLSIREKVRGSVCLIVQPRDYSVKGSEPDEHFASRMFSRENRGDAAVRALLVELLAFFLNIPTSRSP